MVKEASSKYSKPSLRTQKNMETQSKHKAEDIQTILADENVGDLQKELLNRAIKAHEWDTSNTHDWLYVRDWVRHNDFPINLLFKNPPAFVFALEQLEEDLLDTT